MSPAIRKNVSRPLRRNAPVFAALGDETRLSLLARLGESPVLSISRLTEGSALTRQAITKHLRILEHAGLVSSVRRGRESLFRLEPRSFREARKALETISQHWDDSLARLKAHVEQ
jgi:DNA-binding transcriptional ArsR family regulator